MALLFVLPSFEGPRNVLLVVYLISWCVLGWKKKQYGGRVKIWECALGLFLVSGIVSSFSKSIWMGSPCQWCIDLCETHSTSLLSFQNYCYPARNRVVGIFHHFGDDCSGALLLVCLVSRSSHWSSRAEIGWTSKSIRIVCQPCIWSRVSYGSH